MSYIAVTGHRRLSGRVTIQGAKNSVLPILSASLLCNAPCVIHNCPVISDVTACINILEHLGCRVQREDHTVLVDPTTVHCHEIPDELMREMRSSIVFLGAMLARCGQAALSLPGGCELGPRPIDLHLSALAQMGVTVEETHGKLFCTVARGALHASEIVLPIPSVGATENIMIAAVTAKGRTVIRNAAREPEITDLAQFLNRCGAKIRGYGEGTVMIDGVDVLQGCEHTVIPDRIVAATYMAAVAIAGGEALLDHVIPQHLYPTLPFFRQSGCRITLRGNQVRVKAPERLQPMKNVITGYYPGFPTDAQPILMAMATVADGTSIFVENIFESRYHHVHELSRLGAKIKVEGRMAVVEGTEHLSGAMVKASDLRGGAALVLAGLKAEGETQVHRTCYIARGYEDIVQDLARLQADVCWKKD